MRADQKRKNLIRYAALFVLIELILGFLMHHPLVEDGYNYAFLSIVLAFVFAFCFARVSRAYLLTQAALAFTVIADYYLVICSPMVQLPAMLAFTAAQICYGIRLTWDQPDGGFKKASFVLRAGLSLVGALLAFVILGEKTDALAVISIIYYANLLTNLVVSVSLGRRAFLFALGLLCFLLCDTLVGIEILGASYINLPQDSFLYQITHTGVNLAWVFYLPSQTLIVLDLAKQKIKAL